ncbi:hypothetical protein TNIN_30161 [Trichonephila inaurata madagascariensis]|uniref:Uncharacterized protein n=1 Tax=Trichonephila inaurata madagascariensis TaxID=2747483 RepID=A0A8X6Y910_9ARAC|nr:hypothetical protein TNIN_30161 [Trichonephila inaurata madagascariensis]
MKSITRRRVAEVYAVFKEVRKRERHRRKCGQKDEFINLWMPMFTLPKLRRRGCLDVALLTANALTQISFTSCAWDQYLSSRTVWHQRSMPTSKRQTNNNAAVAIVFCFYYNSHILSVFHITPRSHRGPSYHQLDNNDPRKHRYRFITTCVYEKFYFSSTINNNWTALVLTGCMMLLVANTNLNEVKEAEKTELTQPLHHDRSFLVAILNIYSFKRIGHQEQ